VLQCTKFGQFSIQAPCRGFLSLNDEEEPPQVSLLSTSNEGLNTVEIGTLSDDGGLLLNMTYMQIHPSLDLDVLPVGVGPRLSRVSVWSGFEPRPFDCKPSSYPFGHGVFVDVFVSDET